LDNVRLLTMHPDAPFETNSAALGTVRVLLLAIMLIGIIGTMVELLLLGHFSGLVQITPLLLLLAGFVVVGWQTVAPGVASVRVLQLVMVLFLSNGLVGIGYHYGGNEIAAREETPKVDGGTLLRVALVGASPVLAPGSMVLLGLVGLTYAHRHPSLTKSATSPDRKEGE
jgi:hypothetical protein